MKKSKLPLPVLILISAILFMFSSTFGEWLGRPSSPLPNPASETVEQQQAAILYLQAMAWLSRVITHPTARAEDKVEWAQPAAPDAAPAQEVKPGKALVCTFSKPSHPSATLRKTARRALSCSRQLVGPRSLPAASRRLEDPGSPASGS